MKIISFFHYINLIIWISIQILYIWYIYYTIKNGNYSNILNDIGLGLIIAKCSAGIININFALLFIFINKLILIIISNLSIYIPFNFNINYHLIILFVIYSSSLIHTCAHIYNFIILSSPNPWISIAGITGYLLILCLIIIGLCSIEYTRKKFFNTFKIVHFLYYPIIMLLLLHGSFCFVKTNDNQCTSSSFWKFIIVPLFLFISEKIYNEYKQKNNI